MRVPGSALGHLVQCPHCEALFVAQAADPLPVAEVAPDPAAEETACLPAAVAVAEAEAEPPEAPPPPEPGPGRNGRAAEAQEIAWVEPVDEEAPAEPPPARPLTLTVWVPFDAGGVLRGTFRGRLTPEGLYLVNAARRCRAGRRRPDESDDLLLPPGTPTRYVGSNRLRVQIDGRRVVLAVSRFGAYHPQLAREVADFLAGDKGPPDPARHRFRWSRLVPAAVPLGLPLAAWLGGWLPVGLFLAPVLALVCLALALTGQWRPAARVVVSLALAAAGYLLVLAGPQLGGNLFAPQTLPPSAWVGFSSAEGRFAVSMPGTPRQSTQKTGQAPNQVDVHVFEVLVHSRDLGFYVHYFEAAPGLDDNEFTRRIRESIPKDFPRGVITSDRPVWVNGLNGREFRVSLQPRGTLVRQAFLVRGRGYLVSVSGSNLNPDAPDVTRFFNSFRVTDAAVAPAPAVPPAPAVVPGPPGPPAGEPVRPPPFPGMPPAAVQPRPGERPPLPANRPVPPSASSFAGLLAYWPFDRGDGKETPDRTGQAGAGALHGAVTVPGIRGKALHFNGRDAYCDCGGSPRLNFAVATSFTVAGWVRTTEREGAVVSLRNSRNALSEIDVLLMGRRLIAEVRDDGNGPGQQVRLHGAVPVNDGAWHHFAVTRSDGNRIALYVDGWLEEQEVAGQAGGQITTDLRALGCERSWVRNGFFDVDAQYLDGDVDEFCVYGRALRLDEIKALASVGPLPPGFIDVPDPVVEPPQAARPPEPPANVRPQPPRPGPNPGAPPEPPQPPADVVTLRERSTVRLRPGDAGALALSPDGKMMALPGGSDVRLVDVTTGAVTATWRVQGTGSYRLAFSPDGKTLAVGCLDSSIRLWEVSTGKEQDTFKEGFGFVHSLAYSPDGKTLAAGSDMVRLWDPGSGKGRALPQPEHGWVTALAFSPDSKVLASGGVDKMVHLWDVATEKELATLKGHTKMVLAVAFSPDGTTLASGSADRTVKLWDVATGKERLTLTGHADPLSSVAFSPDGRTLVTGAGAVLWNPGHAGEVRLWDAGTGRPRAVLQGHADGVSGVAFTPDGRTVLASGADGTVRLWDVSAVLAPK
jgi:DNA-binding beta-propeller fold protein YncE